MATYKVVLNYGGIDYEDTVQADSEEEALIIAGSSLSSMLQRYGSAWPVEEEDE